MSRNLPIDSTLAFMRKHKVPLTRANYIHIDSLGQISLDDVDGEVEADIPDAILVAEERAIRRADRKFLREVGITGDSK